MTIHAQVEQEVETATPNLAQDDVDMGNWVASTGTNPTTEETYVSIAVLSQNNESDSRPITLVITCFDHNLDLYIDWNNRLGRVANVFTGIDLNRVQARGWRMSVNDQATYYSGVTADFIQELLEGTILNAEILTATGRALSASIELEGMPAAMKYLYENCEF